MTDHILELTYSKDGGHTKADFTPHDLGEVGTFCLPIIKRRLGIARQLVVTGRTSSPRRATIIGLSVMVSE